ncbi:peptidoglycan recognition protein family protein [Streptomyces palmae]|uniref:N-acetylmuramoyl-L-alanine amidase n=1 Tax=Streptomyces palmae TaxID=1701085 RepID=A0A4Z0GLR0_9ACTN|nr:peptidoglycan recognition protein [Streptomyces palmae]TGA97923.1 N-acetylmuramoyl-L-alanine amidase [Streptomyces palmae]
MRALLASSIGVVCATALALPLTVQAGAAQVPDPTGADKPPTTVRARTQAAQPRGQAAPDSAASVSGSTQSLPLTPLDRSRPSTTTGNGRPAAELDTRPLAGARNGRPAAEAGTGPSSAGPQVRGVAPRVVRPFSLLGAVWDDPAADLHGRVQVRTRAVGSHRWSAWQELETHNDDAPDADSPERRGPRAHGSTIPLWVGDSDGVQARVLTGKGAEPLPAGLRLDLIDPGKGAGTSRGLDRTPEPPTPEEETVQQALQGELSELDPSGLEEADMAAAGHPFVGPRPPIITRAGWGADESLRGRQFSYNKTVKAAFIHHSGTGNNYTCAQAPALLRSIYRYHVKTNGWRDFGYNFAIDKCGNIYEGRAGGVARAVQGAHTLGFNTDSMGIAVLGTYSKANPPKAAVNAIAKLTAWKLGLFDVNPRSTTTMVSGGSNKYRKGTKVKLRVISGHRDGFATDCPGNRLYGRLGTTRTHAAGLQGR